ncbi:MAG: hypothetical protein KGY54_08815 [Oleiphilaceae bacterium]|nr:hypothetical protein [Oleiphilaceae bacterium]
MASNYLTPEQDQRLRHWETWNRNYFIFAFFALTAVLIFSSQLGLSSEDSWGPLGLIIAALIAPIIFLQSVLSCPACGRRMGWRAKLMAPDQCRYCGVVMRSKNKQNT